MRRSRKDVDPGALTATRGALALSLFCAVAASAAEEARSTAADRAALNGVGAGSTLRVLEQSFDADLLTPQALLEKYIGRRTPSARSGTE